VERGIGETRAALIDGGEIVETRIQLDGTIPAGTVIDAQLIDTGAHGRNGIARTSDETEYLLPFVPRDVTEGQTVNIEVTRSPLSGPEPWKRPLAKATLHDRTRPRSLAGQLRKAGEQVRELIFPAPADELMQAGWNDVIDEARGSRVEFAGGSLGLFVTPAMTLIDVDGSLAPADLVVRGAEEAAGAIRRLDIGGPIGIDLPTVPGKQLRAAAAEAFDRILPKPFERTSVNGFGFLQIVRPRPRASLLELAQDRASFEARALLRRVAFDPPGPKRLGAHPAVIAVFEGHPEWLEELSRHVGGEVGLRVDPKVPMSGGYAENA
jgi:hypothetical protein